jgi:hypothetical protein
MPFSTHHGDHGFPSSAGVSSRGSAVPFDSKPANLTPSSPTAFPRGRPRNYHRDMSLVTLAAITSSRPRGIRVTPPILMETIRPMVRPPDEQCSPSHGRQGRIGFRILLRLELSILGRVRTSVVSLSYLTRGNQIMFRPDIRILRVHREA